MDRSVEPDETTLELIRDLHDWGAAHKSTVERTIGRTKLQALSQQDVIRILNAHNTPVVVLGRRGREHVGLSPSWITAKDAAHMHLKRRKAREQLEARGFRYVGAYDRVLRTFHSPEGVPHYLATSLHLGSRGYTSRSALRLLTTYRDLLSQTHGVLILASHTTTHLQNLARKHPGRLKLLEL